jgi:polyhydroxyalkanoate synthase subunit PhaC
MSDISPSLASLAVSADPAKLTANLFKLAERAAELSRSLTEDPDVLKRESDAQVVPTEQISKTLGAIWQAHAQHPDKLMEAQSRLWAQYGQIWSGMWARSLGQAFQPVISPSRTDKRFKDKDWSDHVGFDALKQAYLATSQWVRDMIQSAEGVDAHTKQKAAFYAENILNALSPTNNPSTNPEVLRALLASNGENLLRGLEKLENDLNTPDGRLRITQVNKDAFKLGENIATTPGKVVYRNTLFELIQYTPQTARTHEVPLLIVPPWINKYYILDLTAQKSFVRYCVESGLTVFIVSWVNADGEGPPATFADYIKDGFMEAVDVARIATGAEKVNTIGFCIGGSLVASALGYLAAQNKDIINTATFFTTQVDFEKAGDLLVYVDEEQVRWIEERMGDKGYLPGGRMADAFNLLRSNELIWSYVINNYLLGKEPSAFDLLYWNSDSTRMPAAVHSFYLRECYLKNKLSKGELKVGDTPIDLRQVKVPVYNLACRDDHIAPLPSVFKLGRYFGGETTLVVSGSGHIAGVVNPPAAGKYQYWTDGKSSTDHEAWLKTATEHTGSWWPHWIEWVTSRSGEKISAPQPGSGGLEILCDAPGEYVRVSGVT